VTESLAWRVHRNLIEVNALMADRVERHEDALFAATRSELLFLNGVMRASASGDAAALLERAKKFFFGLGRGFVVFTWPEDPDLTAAAESAGLFPALEHYPEMVCTKRLRLLQQHVEPVEDMEGATEYWSICDSAYPSIGFPPGLFASTFSPQDLLDRDGLEACVARDDGRAVGCALIYVVDGVGFVGWVASVPEARGRGFAAACTAWVTNRAFDLGADVTSLQASPMGEALYRRLGYEELFSYTLMGAMPPPSAD
jgi:ribosomal protein S18 acetylase RimI-like enzyme